MIWKSVNRLSGKIMLIENLKQQSIQPEAIVL